MAARQEAKQFQQVRQLACAVASPERPLTRRKQPAPWRRLNAFSRKYFASMAHPPLESVCELSADAQSACLHNSRALRHNKRELDNLSLKAAQTTKPPAKESSRRLCLRPTIRAPDHVGLSRLTEGDEGYPSDARVPTRKAYPHAAALRATKPTREFHKL
jgi:hypothetical protein